MQAHEKRTFRGMWVDPKAQLFMSVFPGVGFMIMAATLFYVVLSFDRLISDLNNSLQIDAQTAWIIGSTAYYYICIALTLSVFLALSTFVVGAWLSHRIYGPMVSLKRHVEKLIQGEYSSRVTLREEDRFQDLARDLNLLAENLEKSRR